MEEEKSQKKKRLFENWKKDLTFLNLIREDIRNWAENSEPFIEPYRNFLLNVIMEVEES